MQAVMQAWKGTIGPVSPGGGTEADPTDCPYVSVERLADNWTVTPHIDKINQTVYNRYCVSGALGAGDVSAADAGGPAPGLGGSIP